jgi:RNA-directed DNA polymerase
MKRAGGLFERICTDDALVAAYHRASQRKHNHRSCHEFGRRLGSNIESLAEELLSGDYRPHPCNRFWIHEPKPRLIEAPAFRDLVVQHAVHAAASPEFERRYIDTNFACRTGKGTHAAADWLHAALRRADDTAWVLHIDVRKFFYSIDRDVLTAQIARVIKCRRTLGLMAMFAWRPDATGVPIGNLLSQTFANVYLNALDHYAKRGPGAGRLRPIHGRQHHDRSRPCRWPERAWSDPPAPRRSAPGDQSLQPATNQAWRQFCRLSHLAPGPLRPPQRAQ